MGNRSSKEPKLGFFERLNLGKRKSFFHDQFTKVVEKNDTTEIINMIRENPLMFKGYEVYCLYKAVYHLNMNVVKFVLFIKQCNFTRFDFMTLWNYSISLPLDKIIDVPRYQEIMVLLFRYQQIHYQDSLSKELLKEAWVFGNFTVLNALESMEPEIAPAE